MSARDLDNVVKNLKGTLYEIIAPDRMRALGEETARMVRLRTRLGYGVGEDDKQRRLKPLTDRYVKWRTEHKDQLSEFTTSRRSNLTRTGQMLDSLGVTTVGFGHVWIDARGSRTDSTETNDKILEYVSKKRPFLNLTALEVKKLVRFYSLQFGDLLRRKKLLE